MATATGKTRCVICNKENAALRCAGCSQDFCYNHIADHRQDLNRQLDEIEVNRDVFRQTLTDQSTDPKKHAFIKQIDQWEFESINKIRQAAAEARHLIIKHSVKNIAQIEVRLRKLTDQLRENREENNFFETDLDQWKEEVKKLTEELDQPLNMQLQEDCAPFVSKLYVNVTPETLPSTSMSIDAKWIQSGITVAGSNKEHKELNQLSCPFGIYVDDDQTIYIADSGKDRIMEWKSGVVSGQVVAGGNGQGNRLDQLNRPTDVIVDSKSGCLLICDNGNRRVIQWPGRNGTSGQLIIPDIDCYGLTIDSDGKLYVSDCEKNEVRRFKIGDNRGELVAGGNGLGSGLSQLNYPIHLFVDHEYSVYVSDSKNHRVIKWRKDAKEGIVVAGGRGKGNSLTQLSTPRGVIVDQFGTVYVSDDGNDRVMRWLKEAKQGTVVIGGNGEGEQANQLCNPTGLSFDRQDNLYVVDYGNERVQKFNIDST